MSPVSKRTRPEDISHLLFVAPQDGATLRPPTQSLQQVAFPLTHRAAAHPGRMYLWSSGLVPSQGEGDDIELETPLTSYSDDELNIFNASSQKMTKEQSRGCI